MLLPHWEYVIFWIFTQFHPFPPLFTFFCSFPPHPLFSRLGGVATIAIHFPMVHAVLCEGKVACNCLELG